MGRAHWLLYSTLCGVVSFCSATDPEDCQLGYLAYGIGISSLAGRSQLAAQRSFPPVSLTRDFRPRGTDIVLYGVIVWAYSALSPTQHGSRTKQPNAATLFLRWGPLWIAGNLLRTFGVMVVYAGSAGFRSFHTYSGQSRLLASLPLFCRRQLHVFLCDRHDCLQCYLCTMLFVLRIGSQATSQAGKVIVMPFLTYLILYR